MRQTKPFPIPVSYFSIVLGLSALGLAWRYAAKTLGYAEWVSQALFMLALPVWLLFMLAYIYKWWKSRNQAKEELQNVIQCCFISLIPITTILVGIVVEPYHLGIAEGLIGLGIIGQLAFGAYRAAGLWRGNHPMQATTPIVYLPTVATNFVSATALGTLGYADWGMLFFGAGLFSWLSVEPAILQRLRNLDAVPEALRPIIGIQLAPAFVGCATYLTVNGGEVDIFAKLFIGYGLLQLLFLIRLLPWVAVNGFTVSFWAYSFGLASMASVGAHLQQAFANQAFANQPFAYLGEALFYFASLSIGGLLLGTLWLIARGRFFVR